MRPNAEHVLDYFHIAMRVTVMQQIARGLPPPSETDKDVAVGVSGISCAGGRLNITPPWP
ncbi:hypothetical protein [Sphingomonas sp. Sph1(2015)]|jgi:hypothetical protein|uniref:hypothetical protein n=1 Tax=Sphingomonas sp. Sph1(2015) TaxID=1628084 RepID=UPI001F51B288|nr:hypothetical protein [Sphingomonas sp. Sph1(2015)]